MSDHVSVDPQGASDGLSAWDAGSSTLKSTFHSAAARVLAALPDDKAGFWGNDGPGQSFRSSFKPHQVHQVVDDGQAGSTVVDQIVDLGTNMRTAVDASLDSDDLQAQEMRKARKDL